MTVSNTNDGATVPPYLRSDFNLGTFWDIPASSAAPRGDDEAKYRAIQAAGFLGIQGADPALCKKLGLGVSGFGRVNVPGEAEQLAAEGKAKGFEALTLHAGWGMESDAEVFKLVEDILRASEKTGMPLYIETHRATITQDMFRTVEITKQFPEVRFNGDFSHWYTGLEMVYGTIEEKFNFIQPVFDRVRFLHGRIGNPGCMQVDIGTTMAAALERPYVRHFQEMWTRAMAGFLKTARPGDYLIFAPELLPPSVYYAREIPNAQGQMMEECDRWQQALLYKQIAQDCFAEARRRIPA